MALTPEDIIWNGRVSKHEYIHKENGLSYLFFMNSDGSYSLVTNKPKDYWNIDLFEFMCMLHYFTRAQE